MSDSGVDYDYVISDNVTPRTPEGFIAIERWKDGEVETRVCDVYGNDLRAMMIADGILEILSRDGSRCARIFPEYDPEELEMHRQMSQFVDGSISPTFTE